LAAFAILSIVIHIGLISVSAHCLGDPRHFTKHLSATVANEAASTSGIKSPPCSTDLAGLVLAQAPRAAKKGPGGILEQTGKSVRVFLEAINLYRSIEVLMPKRARMRISLEPADKREPVYIVIKLW